MNVNDENPAGLRRNYRDLPFWNPTHIPAHEVGRPIHRMDLNECPYPPSPKVIAAIERAARDLNRYPDGTCPDLTARIAERTGVPPERICWGAGSTQLLTAIAEVAVEPGEELLAPGLIWRRFAGVFRAVAADVVEVPNRGDGSIDCDGLVAAMGNRTRLLVLLTPNNPTGLMLSRAELERVAMAAPDDVMLFVDEAYHEFALHAGGPDALDVLGQRSGAWVITRTFSKAYALAGLRLGYALCSSEAIANALRLATSTFNVSGIAEAACLAALDDAAYTEMILTRNSEESGRIKAGLRALGIEPIDSVTNFIAADIGLPASFVVAEMRARGVRVAALGYQAQGTFIRVSTGLPQDTDAFLSALAEVIDLGGGDPGAAG